MKKSITMIAVLTMSALAMVSCRKNENTENGKTIIFAKMDTPKANGERTHLGPTTNNFTPTYWSSGDQVAVFSGSENKDFTLTGGQNTPDASFAGDPLTSNSAYCAFYPYSMNPIATQNGDSYTLSFTLPETQVYSAPINGTPTFAEGICPMVAYSTDGLNYAFKNMTGVLKLDLKGVGKVGKIVLTDGNSSAKLHGTATVTVNAENVTPELTSASLNGGSNQLTLICADGVKLNENSATSFYFVVPVGTLGDTGKGFTIDIYNTNDESITIDKSCVEGDIIQRAIISTLAVDEVEMPGAIRPKFTVDSNGTTVEFAPGNLYWNGYEFRFEANQWEFQPSYAGPWNYYHVSHFFWQSYSRMANSYSESYVGTGSTASDIFFTNDQEDASKPNKDFHVNGETGDNVWRTLSDVEWSYLINNHRKKWGSVNGVNGYIIACDDFSGEIAGSYSFETWQTAEDSGLVFLPATGSRNGVSVNVIGLYGYYHSSTPYEDMGRASYLCFESGRAFVTWSGRGTAFSARLVRLVH